MTTSRKRIFVITLVISVILTIICAGGKTKAQQTRSLAWVTGNVFDPQTQPVIGAQVSLVGVETGEILAEAFTQEDGRYTLAIPKELPDAIQIHIERSHFKGSTLSLSLEIVDSLQLGETLVMPNVSLNRQISPAFWIATLIFVVVLIFIATGILHNTLAALVGAAVIFLISYLGRPIYEGLYIFDFSTSLNFIDWNVIL